MLPQLQQARDMLSKSQENIIAVDIRFAQCWVTGWRRMALEDITLPKGLILKKGQKLVISPVPLFGMRETPGEDHMAHLVSTSQNHLGFGHGVHACPGRFVASNEVKIAMGHLILKYDWKLEDDERPPPYSFGMFYNTNPTAKLLIPRRKEKLDLYTLDC
ncbi:hypothetical protein FSARC_7025 [Fusarium sarcochroum]|uniref:Cytochrome P450 monooxygenase n=1 Tax=Fusarium sarcochroum TaxID=1208366 RepID=A0A8H4TVY7_9HYPO|nr:hypothetical protein FSARC_7025 [Fusarium sarcochroum]